jgi:hypothetical protein
MYTLPDGKILNRDIITNTPDPTDNFIWYAEPEVWRKNS